MTASRPVARAIDWSRVTALFGGTFDPPHLGHYEAVRGLFTRPGVARVILLPSAIPPHKHAVTDARHRDAMTRRLAESLRAKGMDVTVDTREIERARRTGQPSYSYDTISELRTVYPELAFVIGTDQLEALPTWSRFPLILDLCHWIVLERKPHGGEKAGRALADLQASGHLSGKTTVSLVPTPAPDVSSTRIREEFARNGSVAAELIPAEIGQYLKENRLYGSSA